MLNDELEYCKELITRKPDRINNDFYKNKLEKIIEKLKKLDEK
jgi:hypothetical protein